MKILLDTSVLLAACGSSSGASREIFNRRLMNAWDLITTPYIIEETTRNLSKVASPDAQNAWRTVGSSLRITKDVFTIDRPAVFGPSKDRPVLFSALAWADLLLTLDGHDFGSLMGGAFYGLPILRPGDFLLGERSVGRLL